MSISKRLVDLILSILWCERVQDRTNNLEHIRTKKMLTDHLTKDLSPNIFQEHIVGMGLLENL
jgi:hypothetical protein